MTIFETPLVSPAMRALSRLFLRLNGWTVRGTLPEGAARCVMIAAPHTSNWDLPYTLMTAFVLRLHIRWLGKVSIFRFPFGGVMRWLGGIPVDRSGPQDLVASAAASLRAATGPVQLVVPPEGTRGRTRHWKTGFWYIAQQAGVPILLAYMDYAKKEAGIGPVFVPSGDVATDMAQVKAFYAGVKGRNADQFENG